MAKTANDLLQGILTTLSNIEGKMDKKPASAAAAKGSDVKSVMNMAGNLNQFDKVKDKTKKSFISFMKDISDLVKVDKGKGFEYFSDGIMKISNALPSLVESLNELGRMKSGQVSRSLGVLRSLYEFMHEMGDARSARRVEKATQLFDEIGKSLTKIAKPMRTISLFMAYLGLSFVVFAGGLLLASAMLQTSSPVGVVGVLIGVVAVIVGIFALFSVLDKFLEPGIKTIKGIGMGFMYLTLGMLGFTLGLLLISSYLGTGAGMGGIALAGLVLMGVVAVLVGMFWLLGYLDSKGTIKKGVNTIKGMGVGFLFLILGILSFTLGLVLIATLLGLSGNPGGIALAMGVMALVVAGMVGLFYFMGKAAKNVALGTLVAILVSIGIAAIAFSMIMLAKAAKEMATLFTTSKDKPPKKILGMEVPEGIAALGMIGLVFLGAVAAFALLGIPAVAGLVALGAGVAILISVSLILFAVSVQKLVKATQVIPVDFPKTLSSMIGGVLMGLVDGVSSLGGTGGTPMKKLWNFAKNSAIIFASVGILMAASISLSMFAHALTAFAQLGSMRPIIGTDSKGKPIFGDPVNISQVSTNISTSISTFLTALLDSTEDLTKTKAKAIKKMGRALTGKRGILSAVSQFADVLKIFGEFGPEGKIGYVEAVPSGKVDEDGNPIYKQEKKYALITDVARNIANSFGAFVEALVSKTAIFEVTGEKGKKMMDLAATLMGSNAMKVFGLKFGKDKPGLLAPIAKFSEILAQYSGISADGTSLPIIDPDTGKVIKTINVKNVASGILGSLEMFAEGLGSRELTTNTERAEKNIGKFSDLMEEVSKIANSMDGITRMTTTIQNLADGIGSLAINVDKLNTDKLGQIFDKSAAASSRMVYTNQVTTQTVSGGTSGGGISGGGGSSQEVDWDRISQMIGEKVGAQVSASLKGGHFVFEFDTTKSGGIYYWSPK